MSTKPNGVFSATVDGERWWYARVSGRVFGDYREKGEAEACLATEQRRAAARKEKGDTITIRIDDEVAAAIESNRRPGESDSDVIRRMLQEQQA